MSASAIVWLVSAIAVIVVLALAARHALRAVREAQRLRRRAEEYRKLPLFASLSTFERDTARLEAIATRAEPLVARALVAIAVIRRGPLPPDVIAAYHRVRGQVAAFRRLRSS
jgi:hypothetical protein